MAGTLPFAVPIGLSAFLLFAVEPLVGRLVLPVFGGTPAAWATTLFFFQAVLLGGYLYGHLSVTRLGRWGPPIHLLLAALGFVALIVAPSAIAPLRDEGSPPALDLLRILVVLIGLPAFVLTTTTPVLSGWFREAGGRERDPYWLYALSNGGSLLALLAYPFLIEPGLGLATQRGVWSAGYLLLFGFIAWAAVRTMSSVAIRTGPSPGRPLPQEAAPAGLGARAVAPIDWRRRLRWLLLAAVPSGLLSAVTNFIATDLVSAPLLWVVPLAIYLASFVIAFSRRGGRVIRLAVAMAPAMATLLWVPYAASGVWPIGTILAVELVAFAVLAVALNGRLANDRPEPTHLTQFYLVLSTGGALASAFVALVAPAVFPDVWEYPTLLVGALVALAVSGGPGSLSRRSNKGFSLAPFFAGIGPRLVPYGLAAGLLVASMGGVGGLPGPAATWLLVGGLLLAVGGRPWLLAVGTAGVLVLATGAPSLSSEFQARSFFGVTRVIRDTGPMAILMNGTTVHGTQWLDPARRDTPTTYYGTRGPAGDIFRTSAEGSATRPATVGIVGLGAGTLAAYEDRWTTITYFEIDPVVIRVATDSTLFTYLSDAPVRPKIVEGDARLSLAVEPAGRYDLLVLDAFSSDSIPVHLLTVEAIRDELRTLVPDGVIAFHVSNRYYQLTEPIAAALQSFGITTLERVSRPEDTAGDASLLASRWLVASRNTATLDAYRREGWQDAPPAAHPFTDDYADLLAYLRIGF
jgi:hypothetical protein